MEAIKRHLWGLESSLKGTAPSYLNLESDRQKPGSLSPLSSKGYERLAAELEAAREEAERHDPSARKINMALDHARATNQRAALAYQAYYSEPGAPRCWPEGSDTLLAYHELIQDAAEFVEKVWPGTRLRVHLRPEDEPQKTLVHARNFDNNRRKSERAREDYKAYAKEIRAIREAEGIGTDAAIEVYRERLARHNKEDVSVRTLYRALESTRPEEETA